MGVYRTPDMDQVTTKTDLVNYFKTWLRVLRAMMRDLATDAGMLRAMCKAQDERQGTKSAPGTVRPMLWASLALMPILKALKMTASRVQNSYGAERKNPARRRMDWDS